MGLNYTPRHKIQYGDRSALSGGQDELDILQASFLESKARESRAAVFG